MTEQTMRALRWMACNPENKQVMNRMIPLLGQRYGWDKLMEAVNVVVAERDKEKTWHK